MSKNLLTRGTAIVGRLELFGGGQLLSGDDPPVSGTLGVPERVEPSSLYLYTGGAHPVLMSPIV